MAYDDRDFDDDLDIRKPRGSSGEEVPNYLFEAVFITLCCCLPFGIAAIVNAAKVNPALARGDYDEAVQASEAAKKMCWIGFILGIFLSAIYVLVQFASLNRGGGFR